MQLIPQYNQSYGTITVDFYQDKDKNIYVTSEQLAQGFGYKSKKGIERILERNNHLRKKEYSITTKVPHSLGGTQETRLFTKRGIFEIGALSRTEQGKLFRTWIFDYIEKLEEELTRFKIARALEKPQRRKLTDAIKEWEHVKPWSYKHVTDLLFKSTTGMNAKQLKANRNMNNALDSLTANELERYSKLENAVIALIDLQKSYDEVRIFISEN